MRMGFEFARKIKANLVSVHVDRLVKEGYLERRAVEGDRRKTELICTQKAQRSSKKEDSCRKHLRSNCFLVWMKRCSDRWKKWSDEWNESGWNIERGQLGQ